MTYRAAIALGSNLGDRHSTLSEAVGRLEEIGDIVALSALYETAPVGGPEQDPYLNAVAVMTTDLEPADLLSRLQGIETDAGRVRRERWGPRTLDLDIIAIERDGEPVTSDTEILSVPHPRAAERRFVLQPLAEVWPDVGVAPGLTAAEALTRVGDDQGVERLGSEWQERNLGPAVALFVVQMALFVVFAVVAIATATWSVLWLVIGAVLVFDGAAISIWGVISLGKALTPLPEPRPGTTVVTTGPYRLVRHPIYAGIILAMVGAAIAVQSLPAFVVALVTGGFLWFKARYEEKRLRLTVEGYPAYQRRVKGRFVPLP